jgi:HEAT repeat protein
VKDSIVRCLSVPWVGNKATAELIEEFRRYAPILPNPTNVWVGNKMRELSDEEKKAGPFFQLAWTIGNALSIVDVSGFEGQILELCRNRKYGAARQMLVLSLGRLGGSEAEETAVQLLRDEGVQLHAIGALGKMKSKRALFELERLVADKRPEVRKEARKAITKIMR